MPITPTLQNLDNPEYAGEQELYVIEQNLTRYNSGLVHKFIHYLNPNGIVLDFGAGIGTLAILWTTITKKKPYCIEIDEKLRSIITNRGLVCFDSLNSMPGSVDGIYTSSVLEHIENDNEVIQQLHSKLKDKSYLLALFGLHKNVKIAYLPQIYSLQSLRLVQHLRTFFSFRNTFLHSFFIISFIYFIIITIRVPSCL